MFKKLSAVMIAVTMFKKLSVVMIAVTMFAASCGRGEAVTVVDASDAVAGALAQSAEATSYRFSTWTSQTIELPFAGLSSTTEADESAPTIVASVSPGRQHAVMDLAALLGPLATADFDLKLEMWSDDERVVLDTSSFGQIAGMGGEADLGPFAPGVSFVDLGEIGATSPELINALSGASLLDLPLLAEKLPDALSDLEQVSTDPRTFTGTTTLAELSAAQGQDFEQTARSIVAGMALSLPIDAADLAATFADAVGSAQAQVTVELSEQGLLHVLSTRQDMSNLYSGILESDELFAEVPEAERRTALKLAEKSTHIVETRTVFEPESNLVVPLPPETTDDRTELFKALLTSAGVS